MTRLLLDTCAVIWVATDAPLHEPFASQLRETGVEDDPLLVSPMTAWEIAMLTAKGRLALALDPLTWFNRFCASPGVGLAGMSPAMLIASCSLPGLPPADPVDRILAATARAFGHTLVTRDRRLLDYGKQGHVRAMPC